MCVSSGCQVSWFCFSCKQAYQYLCDSLWLLKLSFRKKWTKHKWRVFKLSWQLVHFTIYSDKCASYSECLWLKSSVWKYDIVLPILYHSPMASNLFNKQQTVTVAHAASAPCLTNLQFLSSYQTQISPLILLQTSFQHFSQEIKKRNLEML